VIKRFRFTIAALVIGLVAYLFWHFWYNRTPEGCKPVVDLLDFNTSQTKAINDKTGGDEPLSPVAEDAAYGAWADGLAERSGKVTDPNLAPHAILLADLANQFVTLYPHVRAVSKTHVQGAPTPPEAFQLSILSDRISEQVGELTKACKR